MRRRGRRPSRSLTRLSLPTRRRSATTSSVTSRRRSAARRSTSTTSPPVRPFSLYTFRRLLFTNAQFRPSRCSLDARPPHQALERHPECVAALSAPTVSLRLSRQPSKRRRSPSASITSVSSSSWARGARSRTRFARAARSHHPRPSLDNALLNLSVKDAYHTSIKSLGFQMEDIVRDSVDAGPGAP